MDKERAKEAASWLEDFYKAKSEPQEQGKQSWNLGRAAAYLAERFIPDDATVACATLDDNDELSIAAFSNPQLYLLSVAGESGAVSGNLQLIRVAADTGTVELKTSHTEIEPSHERGLDKPPWEAAWRFKLDGGVRLTLSAKRNTEGRVTGEQECKLAKELARALDWRFPGDPDAG